MFNTGGPHQFRPVARNLCWGFFWRNGVVTKCSPGAHDDVCIGLLAYIHEGSKINNSMHKYIVLYRHGAST